MGEDLSLATLIAREEIRDLAALYCRAIDRRDLALCRSLYTADGWDRHGGNFDGTADDFIAFLAAALPHATYTGHHLCNHLIAVDGDEGEGEVYALAYHVLTDERGELYQDVMAVRYLDRYRKEGGRWRFARRDVTFDAQLITPLNRPAGPIPDPAADPSYGALGARLFARGAAG
jgi:hypothetical protein